MSGAAILIVAKAPVPGVAKTRLAPRYGPCGAAYLAAASLLDTLRTARRVTGVTVFVAQTGDLRGAVRRDELQAELNGCTVFCQRGESFAERLVHAHVTTAALGMDRVVQIGMDTPQVGVDRLAEALDQLDPAGDRCVLGDAADGGWWAFGTVFARGSRTLATIPMSCPDTGARTRSALRDDGLDVVALDILSDVDEPGDVARVGRMCPADSEFARTAALLDQEKPLAAAGGRRSVR